MFVILPYRPINETLTEHFVLNFNLYHWTFKNAGHRMWHGIHSFIHSFIHTEHLYSASSRKLLRSAYIVSLMTGPQRKKMSQGRPDKRERGAMNSQWSCESSRWRHWRIETWAHDWFLAQEKQSIKTRPIFRISSPTGRQSMGYECRLIYARVWPCCRPTQPRNRNINDVGLPIVNC